MEALRIQWHTEKRSIAELKRWDKNPRKISEEAYARLKKKVLEEGMHQVLAIDTDNTVLSGNQRLQILQELGHEDVYVMVPERALTQEERDKVGIQSNIIEGTWDVELLAKAFDIPMLHDQGLSTIRIPKTPNGDPDAVPEKRPIAISRVGDIYQIGEHRLMCGSARSAEDMGSLMAGMQASMVFTDPPYGVEYEGKTSEKLHIQSDTVEGLHGLLSEAFARMQESMRAGAPIYVCYAEFNRTIFIETFKKCFKLSQLLVWVKDNFTLGRYDYHWRHEGILYGWKEGEKHNFYGGRTQDTVWEIPRPKRSEEHPTMKPVDLVSRCLLNSSRGGEIVLDPFLGSGTTMVSAEKERRICYGMELDPVYVDVIIRRMLALYSDIPLRCLNRDVDVAQFR